MSFFFVLFCLFVCLFVLLKTEHCCVKYAASTFYPRCEDESVGRKHYAQVGSVPTSPTPPMELRSSR